MEEHEWAKHQRDGWTYCLHCGMVRNQGKETPCKGELPKVEPRTEKKTFLSTETCGTCEEREAELRRLRAACESMAECFEAAVRYARRPKGGQQVSFHGDFAAVTKYPSFVQAAEWWARHLRTALKGEL